MNLRGKPTWHNSPGQLSRYSSKIGCSCSHGEYSIFCLQVDRAADMEPNMVTEAAAEVEKERRLKEELEKELKLEVIMKAEMEMAMKLLEKDVHEKQDTMVTLRAQLEDIKAINLEMVTKLAECEKSLSYKTDLIQRLEMKSVAMGDTLQQLDTKFVESERSCMQVRFKSDPLPHHKCHIFR